MKNWLRAKDGTVSPKLVDDKIIRWMSVIGDWEGMNTWRDVATMLIRKGIEAWRAEKDARNKAPEQKKDSGQVTLSEYMADKKQKENVQTASKPDRSVTERRKKVARWFNVFQDTVKVADTLGMDVDTVRLDLMAFEQSKERS